MKFDNSWMRLEEYGSAQYIVSDGKRFLVTFVSPDIEAVNAHCEGKDDRGIIATDQDGNHFVAMLKDDDYRKQKEAAFRYFLAAFKDRWNTSAATTPIALINIKLEKRWLARHSIRFARQFMVA